MSALRLMVVHNQLVGPTGHAYTESLGWRRLCDTRGHDLSLFASRWADPAVLAETGARPVFGLTEADLGRFLAADAIAAPTPADVARLQAFMLTSFEVASGCRDAWGLAHEPDLVIFPWTNAALLNGVADWLVELAPEQRPRLVFNVVQPEPGWVIDAANVEVSGDFSWMRFACRRLRALVDPARVALTAVEPRLARLVAKVGDVDCRPGPLHKFYPTPEAIEALRPAGPAAAPIVSALGADRPREKGWDLLPDVMGAVCAATDASFFVQVSSREAGEALSGHLHAAGRPARVTIQPGALPTEDYFRRVLASDLILMPYIDRAYALMPSGIFADAVVCGTPVAAPARTWISDRMAEGWGAGELFDAPAAGPVADAVIRALSRRDELRATVAGQAPAWRRAHSLEAYVDTVFARLGVIA
ncbi:MAG TPA: hypothetical protein VKU90_14040 [Caulobacteraceae bacterium]|nr:hypothetical protein [Caulobacteraceae bacterium]